jgi:hypothetical protein
MTLDHITYDFERKRICKKTNSAYFKTISYEIINYAWFYVYNNEFFYLNGYFDCIDGEQTSIITKVRNFMKNAKQIENEDYDNEENDYYLDDGEYCTIHKYTYKSNLNDEIMILYKIVVYANDWIDNPYRDINEYGQYIG